MGIVREEGTWRSGSAAWRGRGIRLLAGLGALWTLGAAVATATVVSFTYAGTADGVNNEFQPVAGAVFGMGSYDDAVTDGDGRHPLLSFSFDGDPQLEVPSYACPDLSSCSDDPGDYFTFDPALGRPVFELHDDTFFLSYLAPAGNLYSPGNANGEWEITTLHVPCAVPADRPTIQAAVDDPLCNPIVLATNVYFEHVTVDRDVVIEGHGSTIDGGGTGRPLTVTGTGVTVSVSLLALENGVATGVPLLGGGLLVRDGAHLTGTELTIANNVASTAAQSGFGGGMAVQDATANLTLCTVSDNRASQRAPGLTGNGSGGGLYVNGTGAPALLQMTGCTIANNVAAANSTTLAAGGGLRVGDGGTALLDGNTWSGNVARQDGACPACAATGTPANGGAIAVVVTTGTAALHAFGDTFTGNTADLSDADLGAGELPRGGAISLLASNTAGKILAALDRVTVVANRAKAGSGTGEGRGGGIHARGATLHVRRSLITDNRADSETTELDVGSGGGIYVREPSDRGDDDVDVLHLTSTVVARNQVDHDDPVGAQVHVDYSNAPQNDAVFTHVTLADQPAPARNPHTALLFLGPTAGDRLLVLSSIVADHAVGIANTNASGFARGRFLLYSNNGTNH